jgi:alpha-L-rhamnosidase
MAGAIRITHLRTEYRENPLGLDVARPRLSWWLESTRRGARQTAYQVVAAGSRSALIEGQALWWDSGKVVSDQSVHIEYAGPPLASARRVWWRVRVWDEADQPVEWSAPAWWEMGLLERADWQARWIGAALAGGPRTTSPCPFLRKPFALAKRVAQARLCVTALGVYECTLNGQRVGDDVLMPGWTDFGKRVRYQVYDVTRMLVRGENVLGAILGDGWYCGNLAWHGRQLYGDRPRLLVRLAITCAGGSTATVVSDETWKTAFGPLLESDLLMGESYDARREFPGWDAPGFDDARWLPVEVCDDPGAALVATDGPAMRRHEELHPVVEPAEIKGWPSSRWIFDLGQNMVGRVRIRVSGPVGTTVILRHGEALNPDGTLYTANLRTARQTDVYTLRGGGEETWEPRFTFHGFRYVELSGYPGTPSCDTLTGIVLHSDIPLTGSFECSDPLLNQLQHNIQWGQKGNFLDVPTDCPQRDERLGWTGDAQAFVRTATFNRDVAAFFTKWQQDLADAQYPSGAIPPVAPDTAAFESRRGSPGGPAWEDAFLICPWTIYLCYGDRRLLETYYDAFARFVDDLLGRQPAANPWKDTGFWLAGGFGDWLALDGSGKTDGGTPKDLIGLAFFAHDAHLMSRIARVLGKAGDAEKYERLYREVREAFINCFVTPDGLIAAQTQTACVLALRFDLLPEHLRPVAVRELVRDIERRGMHLATGFVGTPHLPHVLAEAGRLDVAYALLLQKTAPSWLYPVTQGATTIWERWDGWTHDKGFQDAGMNSFNHYAYGSIGAWLYAVVAGIDVDPDRPGFKHIILRPRPGGGLKRARAAYDSIYGRIVSDWRLKKSGLDWRIAIPPNTTATVYVPAAEGAEIAEDGVPAQEVAGVTLLRREPDAAVYEVGPGQYHFVVR